jgi:YD repeat-containing protein
MPRTFAAGVLFPLIFAGASRMASRSTSVRVREAGRRIGSFDANGNLDSQTDARGYTIGFTYDALNRFTLKDFPSGTDAVNWDSPAKVKADFATASILKDGRADFNIAGNKYRVVVWINYPYRVGYIRFIGNHSQYDAIDAQTV